MKMTVKECLDRVDALKHNAYTRDEKLVWLNEVEGRIQIEILLLDPGGWYPPEEESESAIREYPLPYAEGEGTVGAMELLVPSPWDKIYISYLRAKIDEANGEYANMANSADQFNADWNALAKWVSLRLHPADKGAVWTGYYIKGEQGAPFTVIGLVASTSDLPESGKAGDAYAVGTDEENVIYIWDTSVEPAAWVSIGPMKGDKGDTGVGIVSIELTSESGNYSTYTITYTDGNTDTFTIYSAQAAAAAAEDSAEQAASSATAAATASTNIAPAYSASATYMVGDYVLYDGGLYRCTTAITTAEAWTSGHWTAVKMGADMSIIRRDVDNAAEGNRTFLASDYVQGNVSTANGNTNNSAKYRCYTKYITNNSDAIVINKIETGYRVNIVYYNSDSTYKSGLTYIDDYLPYTIPANSYYRLCIRKRTEDQSVNSDVPVFVSKVHYEIPIKAEIEALKTADVAFADTDAELRADVNDLTTPFRINPVYGRTAVVSGNEQTYTTLISLAGQTCRITFKNKTAYTVVFQLINCDSEGTEGSSVSIDTVAPDGSATFSSSTRQYFKLRYVINNITVSTPQADIKTLLDNTIVIDETLEAEMLVGEDGTKKTTFVKRYIADESSRENFYAAEEAVKHDALGVYGYPSYYDSQVATALTSIRSNAAEYGKNGETFVFVTDPHWGINAKYSPALIRSVVANTPAKVVLCGGDILDSDTLTNARGKASGFCKAFNFVDGGIKVTFGNHDANQNNHGDQPDLIFSDNEVYSALYAQANRDCNVGGYFYYYFDIPASKTRFVSLSTFFNDTDNKSAQASWFASLMANSADWNVIVFTHYLITGAGAVNPDYAWMEQLIDSNNTNGNIRLVLTGHIHMDATGATTGGIPIVATDTDAYDRLSASNPNTATRGTVTEHCFDVVCVNYNDGTVKCVRIGRGSDRTVTVE